MRKLGITVLAVALACESAAVAAPAGLTQVPQVPTSPPSTGLRPPGTAAQPTAQQAFGGSTFGLPSAQLPQVGHSFIGQSRIGQSRIGQSRSGQSRFGQFSNDQSGVGLTPGAAPFAPQVPAVKEGSGSKPVAEEERRGFFSRMFGFAKDSLPQPNKFTENGWSKSEDVPTPEAIRNAALPPKEVDPSVQAAQVHGTPYSHEGRFGAVKEAFKDESQANWIIVRAKELEDVGRVDDAREEFKKAVSYAPNHAATLRASGHFEDRQGQLQVAESLYRRALTSAPDAAPLINDLALCLARQGRLQEAVPAFSRAIQLRPEKNLYRNNLAKVLVELGDINAAMNHLVAAHGKSIGHYNLAYMLSSRGENQAAIQHYTLALVADPSLQPARDALAALDPNAPAPAPAQVASTQVLPPAPPETPAGGQSYVATPRILPAATQQR